MNREFAKSLIRNKINERSSINLIGFNHPV